MAERNVLLKSLKHPFLVRLHYSFQTAEKLYFVLDYVNGGEVYEHEWMNECQQDFFWNKMSWDFTLYYDQYWNNTNDGIVQYQVGISLSSDVSLGMKYV